MTPVLPGATLGVLGGGQLGRMFALAARRMGYRVHVLAPDDDTPSGQVADLEVRASYDDLDAVAGFARQVDVVTFEFENVPAATAERAAACAPVRPDGHVLHTTQNRLRERAFLDRTGLPSVPHGAVRSGADLERAVAGVGLPAVLKSAAWGYDGKGQAVVWTAAEAQAAWAAMGRVEAVLERFVDLECEISVVGARDGGGRTVLYGPIENRHTRHILDVSSWPAAVPAPIAAQARGVTETVLHELDVVGVLCVEFFVADGRLYVNELAPRPHNSGHLTIDAHVASQFEQQVRAVCGLPLGSPAAVARAAAMANLLGDLWTGGEPRWAAALAEPDTALHLYGKAEARPGRKMGHLTTVAATPAEATAKVLRARDGLLRRP
jgi:5-(carboxyamino)imidazole ribonucleotide synthase